MTAKPGMRNIRDEIVACRRRRIDSLGYEEGVVVPPSRRVPLTPFLSKSGLICEIKRQSPSKGVIAASLDAVAQAGKYQAAGVRNVSVLTVKEGFDGSLEDLIQVKETFPDLAVLRKDFLLDPEDVDVAYRAGADAVLLIAGMMSADRLALLYERAKRCGLAALVEVHDAEDVAKARLCQPDLIGINSRDLVTFAIDPLLPLRVRDLLDWQARVVYESGIRTPEQAAFAAASGFSGLLVGESVVRDPELPRRIDQAFREARTSRFWPGIVRRLNQGRPLVKVCGLTRESDAKAAADCGADILGFVFWEKSRRAASVEMVAALAHLDCLKVGVVVYDSSQTRLPDALAGLLQDGLLDALQFHGDETPDQCAALSPSHYKALKPKDADEVSAVPEYHCPRILLDASAGLPGGNGVAVKKEILAVWQKPLWLAGGLTPENVQTAIDAYAPELVDVASGVEEVPGIKNRSKLRDFLRKVHHD